MAAGYAAVVPRVEIPSGILADRWSRRGVLAVASAALALTALLGGLSNDVPTYIASTLLLGVYFAMYSGTLDAIVYDTVLEETGESDLFERTIGRVRFAESAALVLGALAGGALAELVPLRATYFMTAPLIVVAAVALLRFREPRLHQAEETVALRDQVASTYKTLLERGALRPVVVLMILTALVLQVMMEFGPLWMVDLEASAGLYGPHWAGLMAALGLGALLGGRISLTQPATPIVIGVLIVLCCVALTTSHTVGIAIVAQVLLVLLVVAVSIPLTARLHDAVASTVRAGVASGVGTLTWMTFLPFALLFGALSQRAGVHDAGWMLIAVAAATVVLLVWTTRGFVRSPVALPLEPAFAADQFLPADDPEWPGHWAHPPQSWDRTGVAVHEAALAEVRAAIADLPAVQHDVIVARDVEGHSPAETRDALHLSPSDELDLLHQARGRVRTRLDHYVEDADA
jgi:predicted MFS family arabinose efflux permease